MLSLVAEQQHLNVELTQGPSFPYSVHCTPHSKNLLLFQLVLCLFPTATYTKLQFTRILINCVCSQVR